MADLQFHPAAEIFPLLDGKELDALADDIAENGLQIPVEILDEKIIDGRNRYRACLMRGVEPDILEVEADDPVAYVLSMNLHRRHLSPTQLSMVAARAREYYDKEAKQRQKRKPKSVPENLPEQKGDARDQAGKAVGVSGRSVDYASRVLKGGTPELVDAVDQDKIAVSTAARIAARPEKEQKDFLKRTKGGRPTARSVETREPEPKEGKSNGVGVIRANEAINCLIRIPKNDPLRKRGFQIVTDWIKANR